MGIIYRATNIINGKMYIGKTIKTLKQRIKGHISSKILTHFRKSILKNGIDNFKWEVLCELDNIDDLNEMEMFCIEIFDSKNNGYNMTDGGDGGIGYKHTEEAIQLMKCRDVKGTPHTTEHKIYISEIMKDKNKNFGVDNNFYGKQHTNESKDKMSISKLGKKLSQEHKINISKSIVGRVHSEETKQKIRNSNIESWVIRKNKINNA